MIHSESRNIKPENMRQNTFQTDYLNSVELLTNIREL